ncbi:MAG: hypothetical protein WB786_08665 [Thermoplasmata archaeon]
MSPEPRGITSMRPRLEALTERGRALEVEGLPFPTDNIRDAFLEAARDGDVTVATDVLKRGEALLAHAGGDWVWVRELLRRADELRAVAGAIGVDLAVLDTRVGNPRRHLLGEPLSAASLEKAAAGASLALAVLNDAVPKFCIQEAQALGVSIRRARDRGEEVADAARSFARLLAAIQDQNLPTAAQRLVETRRTVARIPRAPMLPPLSPREEEEILLEARNLARRLQRIKGKARDASSAARLMTQVRAAISEDRRYGTPEEEIEQLWAEVDRLTQEKKKGSATVTTPRGEGTTASAAEPEPGEPEPHRRTTRPSFYVPYVPPEDRPAEPGAETADDSTSTGRGRNRPRPRA